MKERLENVGCLILVLVDIFLSTAAGWGINQVFTKIRWMPDWISVSLSAVIGVVVLIILGLVLVSWLTSEIMNAQSYEE